MRSLLVIVLVFVLAYSLGYWLKQPETDNGRAYKSDCDPSQHVCMVKDGNVNYSIQFKGVPSPLTPFDVILKAEGKAPSTVSVSFEMEDMDMGYNTHQLKANNNHWQSRIILPVCSLARNDWILRVKMELDNTTHISEFSFTQPK